LMVKSVTKRNCPLGTLRKGCMKYVGKRRSERKTSIGFMKKGAVGFCASGHYEMSSGRNVGKDVSSDGGGRRKLKTRCTWLLGRGTRVWVGKPASVLVCGAGGGVNSAKSSRKK